MKESMPYTLFAVHFRELALSETRCIECVENNLFGLPADDYMFLELYCPQPDCDCHRTMLTIHAKKRQTIVATINFGWESHAFYENFAGSTEKNLIASLKGPSLSKGNRQSELADKVLQMVCITSLERKSYVEQLQRHYKLFKDKINSQTKTNLLPN